MKWLWPLSAQHFRATNSAWLRLFLVWGSKTQVHETSECREQPVLKGLICQHDSWLLLIRKDLSSFLHCACWIWSTGKGQGHLLCLTTAKAKSLGSQGSLQTKRDSHPYQTNWYTWPLRFSPWEGSEIVSNPKIHPASCSHAALLYTHTFSKKTSPLQNMKASFRRVHIVIHRVPHLLSLIKLIHRKSPQLILRPCCIPHL